MNLETVLVSISRGIENSLRAQIERNFVLWGANKILKFWETTGVYHLRLEKNITFDSFAPKAAGDPNVVCVEKVEPLVFATRSTSRHLYVGPGGGLEAWCGPLLHVEDAHEDTRGRGALIAHLDSGISYHPELFELANDEIIRQCADPNGAVYEVGPFRRECFEHWLVSDAHQVGQSLTLDQIPRTYEAAWRTLAHTRLLARLDQFLVAASRPQYFSQEELRAMTPRLNSAMRYSDLNLGDFAHFLNVIGASIVAEEFKRLVLIEAFDKDWEQVKASLAREFARQPMVLFRMLSNCWSVNGSGIPRMMHPPLGSEDIADYDGHGTHLAGILLSTASGISPEASYLPVALRPSDPQNARAPDTASLIAALHQVSTSAAHVALVGAIVQARNQKGALARAFDELFSHGVLAIVPVEDLDGGGAAPYVTLPNVVYVGGVTYDGLPAVHNSVLGKVDVWAYGGAVTNGVGRNEYWDYPDKARIVCLRIGGGFDFCSGSSIAAAQVAGIGCLLQAKLGRRDPSALRGALLHARSTSAISPRAPAVLRTTGIIDGRRV